jgi:osmotically inducible lipoprotein OsmB
MPERHSRTPPKSTEHFPQTKDRASLGANARGECVSVSACLSRVCGLLTEAGERGLAMKTMKKFTESVLAAALLLGLMACSGMTTQEKDTAIGAGVGAIGGSVLTGGSAVGTVGGAAVGGVIGHEVGKDKK